MRNDRSKVMDLGEYLIRTKGYNGFSYTDIGNTLDINKSSVHHHFSRKQELGKAIIDRTRDRFIRQTLEWESLSPKDQLLAFATIYSESNAQHLVCFMGALGPAYRSLPEVMQNTLTVAADEIRTWLSGVLKAGKDDGSFQFVCSAEDKADMIISSFMAGLILNRVTKTDVLNNVIQGTLIEIEAK